MFKQAWPPALQLNQKSEAIQVATLLAAISKEACNLLNVCMDVFCPLFHWLVLSDTVSVTGDST